MTTEQHALLSAANLQLRLAALRYAHVLRECNDRAELKAEHDLSFAAKSFTETVNGIDPALWLPPYARPQAIRPSCEKCGEVLRGDEDIRMGICGACMDLEAGQ
jgi:hypothetical protein